MSVETKERLKSAEHQLASSQALYHSRDLLYQRIGSDIPGPDGNKPQIKIEENPLKVALTREAVEKSQLRILIHITELEAEIANLNLIDLAEDYLDTLKKKEAELQELRRLSRHLTPQIIARYEESLSRITVRQETDKELREGLQLLEDRRKQEEEQRRFPKITINMASGEVTATILDESKQARFLERDIETLAFLAAERGQPVVAHVLVEKMRELGFNVGHHTSATIKILRSRLEPDPDKPQIILSFGESSGRRYQLRGNVEFIERAGKGGQPEREEDRGLWPVPGSRLDALQAMIELADVSLAPVLDLLGSDKKNRRLHWATALRALNHAVSKLHMRIAHNVANPAERKIWQSLQDLTQERRNERIVRKSRAWLEKWFQERRPAPSPKKVELVDIDQSRLQALRLVLENPEATIAEVIATLPKTKKGVDFNIQQARVSVVNTMRRIYSRAIRGIMTAEQRQLWDVIRRLTGGDYSDEKTKRIAAEKLNTWFEERKSVK